MSRRDRRPLALALGIASVLLPLALSCRPHGMGPSPRDLIGVWDAQPATLRSRADTCVWGAFALDITRAPDTAASVVGTVTGSTVGCRNGSVVEAYVPGPLVMSVSGDAILLIVGGPRLSVSAVRAGGTSLEGQAVYVTPPPAPADTLRGAWTAHRRS
jgi:hypothetical protein